MRRLSSTMLFVIASVGCGGGATDDATNPIDSGSVDSGAIDASSDASSEASSDAPADSPDAASDGEAGSCALGEATSLATPGSLDLFGTPSYFNDGKPLPPGKYRITYVDGCMKYSSTQGWTVNAYAAGTACWYVIGEATTDRIVVPPGTIGYAAGAGAYASFEDCVNASKSKPAVEFDLTTSKRLGIWLLDAPYSDNVAGESSRNPKWKLEAVAGCGAE